MESDPAIGRVVSMDSRARSCSATSALTRGLLESVAKGLTLEAVEAGINAGGSIGIKFLDSPPATMKMADGTRGKARPTALRGRADCGVVFDTFPQNLYSRDQGAS